MKLEIFESLSNRFLFPAVSFTNSGRVYFNTLTSKIINDCGRWTIARDKTTTRFFLGFLPTLSNVRGYSITKAKGHNVYRVGSCKNLLIRFDDLKPGVYRITDERVVMNDIDFYELEFIPEATP